jgi:predicted TIM-barrel fold metal-dependent hydrolase
LVRLVNDHGFRALRISALYNMIPASDRRYYPLYAKCVELDIPVRIYCNMNYATDRPYDLGHPRHLDQVAMDFPELRIVAGLSGWPWVTDMVALLRRHPNLYCDTASHRPRYFGVPGSGWELFLQFGNTLLQDKIMVGLSWEAFGLPMETLVEEYAALPLKDSVIDKWLYKNAPALLPLGLTTHRRILSPREYRQYAIDRPSVRRTERDKGRRTWRGRFTQRRYGTTPPGTAGISPTTPPGWCISRHRI